MNGHKKGKRILSVVIMLSIIVASMGGLLSYIKFNNVEAEGEYFSVNAYANHWGRSDVRTYLNNGAAKTINGSTRHFLDSVSASDNKSGYASYFSDEEFALITPSTVETKVVDTKGGGTYTYKTTDRFYLPTGIRDKNNEFYINWGAEDISADEDSLIHAKNKGSLIPRSEIIGTRTLNEVIIYRSADPTNNQKILGYSGNSYNFYPEYRTVDVNAASYITPITRINISDIVGVIRVNLGDPFSLMKKSNLSYNPDSITEEAGKLKIESSSSGNYEGYRLVVEKRLNDGKSEILSLNAVSDVNIQTVSVTNLDSTSAIKVWMQKSNGNFEMCTEMSAFKVSLNENAGEGESKFTINKVNDEEAKELFKDDNLLITNSEIKSGININFGSYGEGSSKKAMKFKVVERTNAAGDIDAAGNHLVIYQAELYEKDKVNFKDNFDPNEVREEDGYYNEYYNENGTGKVNSISVESPNSLKYSGNTGGVNQNVLKSMKVTYDGIVNGVLGGNLVYQSYQLRDKNGNEVNNSTNWVQDGIREPGEYRVRVTASGSASPGGQVVCSPAFNLTIEKGDQSPYIKVESQTNNNTYGRDNVNISVACYGGGYILNNEPIYTSEKPDLVDIVEVDGQKQIEFKAATNNEYVKITAFIEGDDYYNSAEAYIDIKIQPKEIGSNNQSKPGEGIDIKIEGFEDDTGNSNNVDGVTFKYKAEGIFPEVESFTYTKENGEVEELKLGTDYDVEYTNNGLWNESGDKQRQKMTMTITGKGNYTGSIVKTYYIEDTTKPTATIKIKYRDGDNENKDGFDFKALINKLTFGHFFKDSKEVEIIVNDNNEDGTTGSNIKSIHYYIDNGMNIMDDRDKEYTNEEIENKLKEIPLNDDEGNDIKWLEYDSNNKPKVGAGSDNKKVDGKYVVYARIEDWAGNITYVSSAGMVVYSDIKLADSESGKNHNYIKTTDKDEIIDIDLKGHSINEITYTDKEGELNKLRSQEDYKVVHQEGSEYSQIILSKTFLNRLNAEKYTLTIKYNPLEEIYYDDDGEPNAKGDKPSETTVKLEVSRRVLDVHDFDFKAVENQAYDRDNFIAPELIIKDNFLEGANKPTIVLKYYKDGDIDGISKPNDMGKYRVKATVIGDDNYEGTRELSSDLWEIDLKFADPNYKPIQAGSITAIYEERLGDIVGRLPAGWSFIRDTEQDLNTLVGEVQPDNYSYFKAVYTPSSPDRYGTVTANIPIKVNPRDLSLASEKVEVTLDESTYTYDGSTWYPNITVKRGKEIIEDYNYDVVFPTDMILIGEKEIKVNFTGNYTGSKTVNGLIDVDRSTWGTEKVINNIKHYVSVSGASSVEIRNDRKDENGIIWLKEESGGTSAWYGIKDQTGIFSERSRFYVNWLSERANRTEWQEAYNQLDEEHKNAVSAGRMMLVKIGVDDPYGNQYNDLQGNISLYVQIGSDWSMQDIRAVHIEGGSDKILSVSLEENMSFVAGKGNFANLALNKFATYSVYDGAKFKTIDVITNTDGSVMGSIDLSTPTNLDNYVDVDDNTLGSLRTIDNIRNRGSANDGDDIKTFVASDDIDVKEQSKSSSIVLWIVIIISVLGILLIVIAKMQKGYGIKYYFNKLQYRTQEMLEKIKDSIYMRLHRRRG